MSFGDVAEPSSTAIFTLAVVQLSPCSCRPAARRRAEVVRGYYGAPKSTTGAPRAPLLARAGPNVTAPALWERLEAFRVAVEPRVREPKPARPSRKRGLKEE